jgi:hypothetical protein
MKLRQRFNGGRRMDRGQITEKKRLTISISTTLRFGVESVITANTQNNRMMN